MPRPFGIWFKLRTTIPGDDIWALDLPNGWTALVSDDSQLRAPSPPTSYRVSASCRTEIRQMRDPFPTFAEAKSAALKFAMEQR